MTTAPLLTPARPEAPTMHRCQSCHVDMPRAACEPLTLDLAPARGAQFDTTMVYRCRDAAACVRRAKSARVGLYA